MEDIRIRNIENYVLSYVNGDLLVTSKRGTSGQAEEHDAMYAAEAAESSGQVEEHAAMYAAEASGSSTEQVHYVSEKVLIDSATGWEILNCLVRSRDTVISTSLGNQTIVKDIWRTMPRNKVIEDRPNPNTYTFIPADTGLNRCREHDLYFHSINNKESIREILHLVKNNQLTIQLTILTKQGDLIHYKA